METVSIRNLRGSALRERARSGEPLAITNHRVLIGVMIPVAAPWVELLIDYNWSHVRQSIVEGEQAMAVGKPSTTIQDVVDEPDVPGPGEEGLNTPERPAVPLVAALTDGTVTQTPESKEALRRLQTVLNPPGSAAGQEDSPAEPSVRTVRIGDLSAAIIQEAGKAGQTLAITHDRELIGIVIPVTQRLVEFLIEQNISRVLYNVDVGEKQIRTTEKLTTLDGALDLAFPGGGASSRSSLAVGIREDRKPSRP
jgi:antitoxin (DNA-binding transcriptional repressor) of toxin-antitoxin stability system